jgi:DNA polymerase
MFRHNDRNEKVNGIKILNERIRKCDRCQLSSGRINAICGEGSLHAKIFFIAQAPGEIEDRDGRMFIGPTGAVMDELLDEIHMSRNEVYMTNLLKCKLPGNRKPKNKEIELCSLYLQEEIAIINPKFLIPLGYHSTKYVLGNFCSEKSLPTDPAGKLFFCNGLKIYPLPHPSSVLFNPSIKQQVIRSFKKIAVFKEDCKWYPVCPMKKFFEEGRLDRKWIELYCKGDWESCVRFQMEENYQMHSDNMLPDGSFRDL